MDSMRVRVPCKPYVQKERKRAIFGKQCQQASMMQKQSKEQDDEGRKE